ncbi:MAG TPA: penicillin acylase family protein [Candidatus Tectomicrobia bacterium]|nr:penicillin acylase family protein [Candidatus Tectomicrobia bacterium]
MAQRTVKHVRQWLLYILLAVFLVVGLSVGYTFIALRAALPPLGGDVTVAGLGAPVIVTFDRFGIPAISAHSRLDAMRALGYLIARDRLFQLDLLRRRSTGQLAEILGSALLDKDVDQRVLGFDRVAQAIVNHLPQEQKDVLTAYAEGINHFIEQTPSLPFEFRALGYRPTLWRIEDSLLVALGMFEVLNRQSEDDERMLSIMARSLPPEVVAFLTPDTDRYTQALLGDAPSHRPMQSIPVDALATLRRAVDPVPAQHSGLVRMQDFRAGSNAWAVGRSKTTDGRALLANDTHLHISVPNIWYRSQVRYGNVELAGVTLAGTPVFVAGASAHLAWGFTNIQGDFLDLVRLEVNPENADEYKTPDGWKRFGVRQEAIKVRGAEDIRVEVKTTVWGPLARQPLMAQPVAIRWTALDSMAVNLGLLALDQAHTLEEGLTIVNHAGTPPLNALVVDGTGRIAWTYIGRIPIRQGFDGATSRSWGDGGIGWTGYIAPDRLPRLIDPTGGFLVTANHRMLGPEYPYVIGHQFANGYRAYRISERLRNMAMVSEQDMLALQLDTVSDFYDYYQQLALEVLTPHALSEKPTRAELRRTLEAWDKRAEVASLGIGLLSHFRNVLAKAVFTPFLTSCQLYDQAFVYHWAHIDTPLQQMLTAKIPQLLPDPQHYTTWDAFILGMLEESARQLRDRYGVTSLQDLKWGRLNRVWFRHPFSRAIPALGWWLDIGGDELPGCAFCVRVADGSVGANMRLVISPGHPQNGLLHMPGGQSGQPLSAHYADQHPYWARGLPQAFAVGPPRHTLRLVPASSQSDLELDQAMFAGAWGRPGGFARRARRGGVDVRTYE